MRDYLETVLGIKEYRIVATEGGVNPLTDQPFPRRLGRRIMTIGIPGGRVKPSSGYAFWRIQQDSAAIVRSLLQVEHPFDVPRRFSASIAFMRLADAPDHGPPRRPDRADFCSFV